MVESVVVALVVVGSLCVVVVPSVVLLLVDSVVVLSVVLDWVVALSVVGDSEVVLSVVEESDVEDVVMKLPVVVTISSILVVDSTAADEVLSLDDSVDIMDVVVSV